MADVVFQILWIVGTMAGALCLGVILLQFFIWVMFGRAEEENNRPLFRNHRHATYKESMILKRGFEPRAKKEDRHYFIRLHWGVMRSEEQRRRGDEHAARIIKALGK